MKKTVKARDCYGLVFDRVKRTNALKLHNAERADLNLQHGAIQGLLFTLLILIIIRLVSFTLSCQHFLRQNSVLF